MGRTGVVTDSTADFTTDAVKRYSISIVPLVVNWDGATYRDKVDLTTADFYRRLKDSKTSPTTGAPNLALFEDAFNAQLERHDSVICVTLASKLSATYDVATQAAKSVDPKRIRVIDSRTVTVCLGWLAEDAAELGEQGKTADEIVPIIEERASRMRIYTTMDSLEYLRRGGRIGRAAALAGTLLNVKPILAIHDGEVHPVERVRTLSGALRRIPELVAALGPIERIAVKEGGASESADQLQRMVEEKFPGIEVGRGQIGSVLGVHGGPGVVGVATMLA